MPIAPSRATTTARVLVGLTVLCLLLIRLENPAHAESSWVRWEHFVFMPYPPLSRHRRPEVAWFKRGVYPTYAACQAALQEAWQVESMRCQSDEARCQATGLLRVESRAYDYVQITFARPGTMVADATLRTSDYCLAGYMHPQAARTRGR